MTRGVRETFFACIFATARPRENTEDPVRAIQEPLNSLDRDATFTQLIPLNRFVDQAGPDAWKYLFLTSDTYTGIGIGTCMTKWIPVCLTAERLVRSSATVLLVFVCRLIPRLLHRPGQTNLKKGYHNKTLVEVSVLFYSDTRVALLTGEKP